MAVSVEQVTYNAPDGATMGNAATEKISFYGATPVVQYPSVIAASTYLVTTNTVTTAAGCAGFQLASDLSTFVSQVSTVVAAMKALGLVA
jgi:hypothetical protein